ncbi:hypothetical protein DFH28DRAFT_1083104 [Melampsora americana]|nr:hypothetical protein DFH28DRAFT_1083104 [Melampsora americana]
MATDPSAPICQLEACQLQKCLNRYTYQPERCDELIKKLYKCCQMMYDENGDQIKSTACASKSKVKEKIEKMNW